MCLQEVDHDAAVNAVRAAFEAGINVFDTSPYYGLTRSETASTMDGCGRRSGLAWEAWPKIIASVTITAGVGPGTEGSWGSTAGDHPGIQSWEIWRRRV